MMPQIPQFMWDEIMDSYKEARNELRDKSDDYLEGMIKAYKSTRVLIAIKSAFCKFNPMSGRLDPNSTRLEIARTLLIERNLEDKPNAELETIAEDKGFLREILGDLKGSFYFNVNHERYNSAREILRKRQK